jgi:hypothetical protein
MKRRTKSWLSGLMLVLLSAFGSSAAMAQCAAGLTGNHYWFMSNLGHQTGGFFGPDWRVLPGANQPAFMSYGPYDTRFGNGLHRASYYMQVDNNTTNPDAVIATLWVYSRYGQRILGRRDITRRDFIAVNQWQWLSVYFDNPCFEQLEANVYWYGSAQMILGQLLIQKM